MTNLPHPQALIQFIQASPTPFHAVRAISSLLSAAGFRPLSERENWLLEAGDRCFVSRNDSSIIAFVVGCGAPADNGFLMIGSHTDSPSLKVKPASDVYRSGAHQLGVEPYGSMLLSTWLDRDLSLAGRVVTQRLDGQLRSTLVDFRRPMARIPNLALHLDREVNSRGLVLNAQQNLAPMIGLSLDPDRRSTFRAMLAEEIGRTCAETIKDEAILDFDLFLYDTQPGTLGGLDEALLFAPRLDNLASCHAAVLALLGSLDSAAAINPTRLVAFWDHEECGSRSAQGAQGPLIRQTVDRILEARGGWTPQTAARAISASMLVSADMAHAVHPNYADRHEPNHTPLLGQGPVIKSNSNQSYATDAVSCAYFISACRAAGIEPQRFVTRSDMPCGSTIGPITSALTGIKTVDVGNPMLSMHSIREMAAATDHSSMIGAMTAFLAGKAGSIPTA